MGLEDYRTAKKECFRLADLLGVQIGQSEAGKPRLFRSGSPPKDYPTWLALHTALARLAADRQPKPVPKPVLPARCISAAALTDGQRKTVLPVARVIGRAPTRCNLPEGRILT